MEANESDSMYGFGGRVIALSLLRPKNSKGDRQVAFTCLEHHCHLIHKTGFEDVDRREALALKEFEEGTTCG